MMAVNHVQNRLLHSKTGISPYEALLKRKPCYNYLRPVGSKVYIQRSNGSGKLAPRFDEGLMIGYDSNSSQYRVWNSRTDEIYSSRNVKFVHTPTETETHEEMGEVILKLACGFDEDSPSLNDVMNGPDKLEWEHSMKTESDNMILNKVMELVPNL